MFKKCFFIALIVAIPVFFFACSDSSGKTSSQSEITYQDDGNGLMTVCNWDREVLVAEFDRWKKDYPERAKRIQGIATRGQTGDLLMVVYGIE